MPRHQATPIRRGPRVLVGEGRVAFREVRGSLRHGLALTNGQKGMSSGSAFLLHSLHAAAVRTVKYVEVRQLLKVLDVPNKLHRGTTMRACRSNGLVSVGHG